MQIKNREHRGRVLGLQGVRDHVDGSDQHAEHTVHRHIAEHGDLLHGTGGNRVLNGKRSSGLDACLHEQFDAKLSCRDFAPWVSARDIG